MNSPIARHMIRLLAEKEGVHSRYELIARIIVNGALAGDVDFCQMCMRVYELYDPVLDPSDDED